MENKSSAATTLSLRLTPEERRLIEEAAEKKGWKAANFLRVTALERAAQVLNLSRPTSFDFSGAAKRLADVLLAPRTVQICDIENERHGPFGEMAVFDPNIDGSVNLVDFRPSPLARDEVDKLREAMRLGGPEFADELIVECRRLGNVANDPNLPAPIDPHKLKD